MREDLVPNTLKNGESVSSTPSAQSAESGTPEALLAILKNTFIETVDINAQDAKGSLRRCSSESSLSRSSVSRSSGDNATMWLPPPSHASSSSASDPANVAQFSGVPLHHWQSYVTGRVYDRSVDNDRSADMPLPNFRRLYTPPAPSSEVCSAPPKATGDSESSEGYARIPPGYTGGVPQYEESPGYPSIGSSKHHTGECSPCVFWLKRSCVKGVECDYCHMQHQGQKYKRIRPSKRTRRRLRASAELALSQHSVGFRDDANDADEEELIDSHQSSWNSDASSQT
jgi:hypothetical protein